MILSLLKGQLLVGSWRFRGISKTNGTKNGLKDTRMHFTSCDSASLTRKPLFCAVNLSLGGLPLILGLMDLKFNLFGVAIYICIYKCVNSLLVALNVFYGQPEERKKCIR